MIRPGLSGKLVRNGSEMTCLNKLLQFCFGILIHQSLFVPVDGSKDRPFDELIRRFESAVQINGSDHCFQRIGKNGRLVPSRIDFFPVAEDDMILE